MDYIDIIIVTYNSEKWIDRCLRSIYNQSYPIDKLSITIVDNNSSDNTIKKLKEFQHQNEFAAYNVILLDKNLGFGKANNIGANQTSSPFIFFVNIDTELACETISELYKAVKSSEENIAAWECRQFPYEHPKIYNPVTLETDWVSGACFLIRRECFEQVKGFDENIFMYCEGVDISWRLRALGYKLRYVPKSVVYHYSYLDKDEIKPSQFYNSTFYNLMLRYRYGNLNDIVNGYKNYLKLFKVNNHLPRKNILLFKNLVKSFFKGPKFRKWKKENLNSNNFSPVFNNWDYEIRRLGAFYENNIKSCNDLPLVSIIVRTCGRPNVLKETLISIRNQTYKNLEVIVVEDGKDISAQMIKEEFNDLNIKYYATGEKVGRCRVGNIGLSLCRGKYINFLDDDDLFFADHVEVLCNSLEKSKKYNIAYSSSFEVPIKVISENPYKYEEGKYSIRGNHPFWKVGLMIQNFFPIQSVMFSRKVYEDLGGFDESLEYLEDWDLWLRYSRKYDFLQIEKTTSIYRVPADTNKSRERQKKFNSFTDIVRKKYVKEMGFENIKNDKEVYIWGAGTGGIKTLEKLEELEIKVKGFIDSDKKKWGKSIRGLKVFSPDILEKNIMVSGSKPFIVVGSMYAFEIEQELIRMGYKKGDYWINIYL